VVSITLQAYKCANTIGISIKGILTQSCTNLEMLAIDNESSDNTKNMIEKFYTTYNRIKYYNVKKGYEIRNNVLYAIPFWHKTVMFCKRVKEIDRYKSIRFIEDWDLWLRLGGKGKLYNFREYHSLFLNAGQNLSANNLRLASRLSSDVLRLAKCISKF
jgi:cellulose synthase/poly-beta-1,6-N-acetylglucosamine synthase-like glycosyltransferase